VQTVETSSSLEARRCRNAQYFGRTAELSLNGSNFFGMVRSVQEDRSDGWRARSRMTLHEYGKAAGACSPCGLSFAGQQSP
jgi:hypothetical protein